MAIDVHINPQATGGLRVIEHIPAERPCRLEGRNGIGKSVAIRLLVLVSGVQPYSDDPPAWRSLKSLVGATTIRLTGLAGEHQVAVVTLTPEAWPDEPVLEIREWLGKLTLNGAPAPISRLFESLQVVHLSGTERLVDTIQRHEARFSTALLTTKNHLLASEDQRAKLGELEETFAFLSPTSEKRDLEAIATLDQRLTKSSTGLLAAKEQLRRLQRAATLASLLAASSGDRQAELDRARADSSSTQSVLHAANARLDLAIKALSKGTQQQKKLAKAERQLREMANLIATERESRSRSAAAVDLPQLAQVGTDTLNPEQLGIVIAKIEAAEELTAQLRRRQYESNLSNEQAEIRSELTVVLDGAIDRGHDAFVAARLDTGDVSVGELREGVANAAITYQPPETGEALATAIARHQTLTAIRRADERIRKASEQVAQVQVEISTLQGVTASDELSSEVESARQARDRAQSQAQVAAIRVGQLSTGLLTGEAGKDALAQIKDILEQEHCAREELPTAAAEAGARCSSLEMELTSIEQERAQLKDAEARRKVRRRDWTTRLTSSTEHGWLLSGLSWNAGRQDDVPWGLLAGRIAVARRTANQLSRDIEGLAAAIGSPRANEYSDASHKALELEALTDFADEHVKDALFDDGRVESLDLREHTITWKTPTGERRTRPLSAFSSGEQALGFIRARLRQLTAIEAENRLIFLDEFGAFVGADRRKPLADLLADDDLNPLSSQIIVVLPLQVDYQAELSQTRGHLHERYAARAAHITENGYFAEKFDP